MPLYSIMHFFAKYYFKLWCLDRYCQRAELHCSYCRAPSAEQKRAVFHKLCKAVAVLHRKRIVHGDLTPDNVFWFAEEQAIKLASFSFQAFDGAPIPLHPALRYAPPEVSGPLTPEVKFGICSSTWEKATYKLQKKGQSSRKDTTLIWKCCTIAA